MGERNTKDFEINTSKLAPNSSLLFYFVKAEPSLSRDSSASTAIEYELEGAGVGDVSVLHSVQIGCFLPSLLSTAYWELLPGSKAAGAWNWLLNST
jgi:hypothetical protein